MGPFFGARLRAIILLCATLLLGACDTRSISNSGYAEGVRGNPFYRGEIAEFDVLGIDPSRNASDEEIARQLASYQPLRVTKGTPLLVIQSGAPIPDGPMVAALERYFSVVPFTGVPVEVQPGRSVVASTTPRTVDAGPGYARTLRLAAARSGAATIFCYWGVLESAVQREPTKAVSWVPIVGAVIPDETQMMRIRLKIALIDVRTGHWSMFAPEPRADSALSASLIRAQSDQEQVEDLKEQAYREAVEAFVAKYAS